MAVTSKALKRDIKRRVFLVVLLFFLAIWCVWSAWFTNGAPFATAIKTSEDGLTQVQLTEDDGFEINDEVRIATGKKILLFTFHTVKFKQNIEEMYYMTEDGARGPKIKDKVKGGESVNIFIKLEGAVDTDDVILKRGSELFSRVCAVFFGLAGLVRIFTTLSFTKLTVTVDENGLTKCNNPTITWDRVTGFDKSRLEQKGRAYLHYRNENGNPKRFTIDDTLLDNLTELVAEIQKHVKPSEPAPEEKPQTNVQTSPSENTGEQSTDETDGD